MLDNKGYRHALKIGNTYSFPGQKYLRERASLLRYTDVACLVWSEFEIMNKLWTYNNYESWIRVLSRETVKMLNFISLVN